LPNRIIRLWARAPDTVLAGLGLVDHMYEDGQPIEIKAEASTQLALDRTVLARERTMLAWVRTATALITFGFSIQQFFRTARRGTELADRLGPTIFGGAMIVIGLAALMLATLEHHAAIRALNRQFPVSAGFSKIRRSRARILAALIGLLGVLGLVVMFIRG
jgi:putative membrane protein